jgi:ABC-type transport system involved in Fe-S cluster assembly fused permease/ATPase subunit
MKAYSFFAGFCSMNLVTSYFDGRRVIENGNVTQQTITKISLKAYTKLLQMDWQYQLDGVKTQIYSLERIKQAIESNMILLNSILLPVSLEISIGLMMTLIFCGPIYFCNFLVSILLYTRFTIHTSRQRKTFIILQNEIDKRANFILSGSALTGQRV